MSEDIATFDYLIVGGGMVADAAARGIRERDTAGTIGILSADSDEPYTRPALSKKLWTDPDFTWDQVPLNTVADTGAELRVDTLVTRIDRFGRTVETADGGVVGYRRLLLATGSAPRTIPAPDGDDRVLAFRSAEDYRRLRELAARGGRILVVGGGYIGTEIAAALAQNGVDTELIFPDATLGASQFPPALAERYQAMFTDGGVQLVPGRRVEEIRAEGNVLHAVLDDGEERVADAVVVGLGADPVVGLAADAELALDDGVLVDEHLITSDRSIWAAGDIAAYPDPILGRTRVEHVDNANEMGEAVGRSMAGEETPYTHTPYFYSQVFGTRWEAVGTVDATKDPLTVDLGDDRAVVYYRDETGAPIGVLLWNVADARDRARAVLVDRETSEQALRDRIR
ncbi:NAD(P)/FAD-dependent oxidoreductase [Microbacterium xanthum]|uniref:NAD(P)/FAD-dependent oxidoreductase n=1 Tax=Microbacterium xanthum TaxID=3079794 RepID=UPI002AD49D63|nr:MULTISPECIES: FAD-dependent oxidoreductase [unclassified Microbacterium]MDZ8170796.1 FAD-dependent oxidoreductase [Microbacterium sp. KSW-48]MDZ8201305.1 FAD-dependent oxidoreductase [Microbacterium sp. SSW1-59]